MRIKFLSVIVSFLMASVTLSSCLKSEENYELSSDATIHAFAIDTIHGKNYDFTIDQLNRVIYNRDSLPVGSDTIIDRILIKTMDVTGWVTYGSPVDTLFVTTDSINLKPAMNNSIGMKFKVRAADGVTMREYTLKVNVHLQNPDSLAWTDMQTKGSIFSNAVNEGKQKAIVLGGDLLVYTSTTLAYKTSTAPDKYNWSKLVVTGLPADAKPASVVEHNGVLYMLTDSKKVYISVDGAVWAESPTLGSNVLALIAGFSDRLCAVLEIDGKRYFNISKDGKNWETAVGTGSAALEEVPADFPTEEFVSTLTKTGNGVEKVLLTGMPLADNKMTTPWFSLDGRGWAALTGTSYNAYCPGISHPVIMHYGDMLYCFGGELDAIYRSVEGLAWYKTKSKFLLPREFKGKGAYSVVVEPTRNKTVASADKRDFIWVVFGGNGAKNEVWRGRLNRLGFEIQ